jgi:indole-3-acetate monooxygenase
MPTATAATRTPQHQALMQAAARAGLALADRSREFETQRALPQEVADMLAEAGLYRLLTPQALGGHEAPPASFRSGRWNRLAAVSSGR